MEKSGLLYGPCMSNMFESVNKSVDKDKYIALFLINKQSNMFVYVDFFCHNLLYISMRTYANSSISILNYVNIFIRRTSK